LSDSETDDTPAVHRPLAPPLFAPVASAASDDWSAFVGSAYLTEAAHALNIEIGFPTGGGLSLGR
jgi:hypothetical protein